MFAHLDAACSHASGRFEDALLGYTTSASAAADLWVFSAEHRLYCIQETAQCYAALSDWKGVSQIALRTWGDGGPAPVLLPPSVELQCHSQGKSSWLGLSSVMAAFESSEGAVKAQLDEVVGVFGSLSGADKSGESIAVQPGSHSLLCVAFAALAIYALSCCAATSAE